MSATTWRLAARPRRSGRLVAVAVVLAFVGAAVAVAAQGGFRARLPVQDGPMSAIVEGWQTRSGAPAVLVAVDRAGHPLWTDAAGSFHRDGDAAASPDVPVRIASVTKPMVATVILQLVAEGRLGLDDRVADWLPARSALVRGATIRHLLAHTGGVPDYGRTPGFGDGLVEDRARTWDPDEIVDLVAGAAADFPPGADHAYSNTGYVLLGMVVEAVTGRSWADELRARVIEPLGLEDTVVPSHDAPPASPPPSYYDLDRDGVSENVEAGPWRSLETSEGPAGAVVATVADVTRFLRALFDGTLLPAEQLAEMTAPGAHDRRYDGYGLGIERLRPDRSTPVFGHGGWVSGQRIVTWYVPDLDTVITVAANDYRADPYDLAELLLRRVRAGD